MLTAANTGQGSTVKVLVKVTVAKAFASRVTIDVWFFSTFKPMGPLSKPPTDHGA